MTPESPGARTRGAAEAESRLVLIVDDNEKNLKLTRDVLRFSGFRTIEAATGAEGIALATLHVPDVILMDVRLPDMDGMSAARILGERTGTARIPVVALSSFPVESSDDWLLASGFAGYLEKPFSVRDFPGQVRRFCMLATQ